MGYRFDYERFKNLLAEIDTQRVCPVCGSKELKLDERVWVLRAISNAGEPGELSDPQGPYQPLAMVVCLQCGFIRLHAGGT